MKIKELVIHPFTSFLFTWFLPVGLFIITIYHSLNKIEILEKKNNELLLASKPSYKVDTVKVFTSDINLEYKYDSLDKLINLLKDSLENLPDHVTNNVPVDQKRKTHKFMDSLLSLDSAIIFHFSGFLKNFPIINYPINNLRTSFTVSDCFLGININKEEKVISGASLYVAYSGKTFLGSIYKSPEENFFEEYKAVSFVYKDTTTRSDWYGETVFAKVNIKFDNQNKASKMQATYNGYLTLSQNSEIKLRGSLYWNTMKVDISLNTKSVKIKW